MARVNHMLGWIVIVGAESEAELAVRVEKGLAAFTGDYGIQKRVVAIPLMAMGIRQPESPLPLLSWSFYQDAQYTCFIAGDFYDKYESYEAERGNDPRLVEMLTKKFAESGTNSVAALNGCFSGFLFDSQSCTLTTFVDRLGVRVLYWSREKDH